MAFRVSAAADRMTNDNDSSFATSVNILDYQCKSNVDVVAVSIVEMLSHASERHGLLAAFYLLMGTIQNGEYGRKLDRRLIANITNTQKKIVVTAVARPFV